MHVLLEHELAFSAEQFQKALIAVSEAVEFILLLEGLWGHNKEDGDLSSLLHFLHTHTLFMNKTADSNEESCKSQHHKLGDQDYDDEHGLIRSWI